MLNKKKGSATLEFAGRAPAQHRGKFAKVGAHKPIGEESHKFAVGVQSANGDRANRPHKFVL